LINNAILAGERRNTIMIIARDPVHLKLILVSLGFAGVSDGKGAISKTTVKPKIPFTAEEVRFGSEYVPWGSWSPPKKLKKRRKGRK
jgi:hypothetical protein